jgi:hypothetical protein
MVRLWESERRFNSSRISVNDFVSFLILWNTGVFGTVKFIIVQFLDYKNRSCSTTSNSVGKGGGGEKVVRSPSV